MALPWVDFVHIDDAPYIDFALPGTDSPPVGIRVLNGDPATGAVTAAINFPPGWHLDTGHLQADLEVFTLAGSARYGEHGIGRYCYAVLPAGIATATLTVGPEGLTALVFADSTPGFAPGVAGGESEAVAAADAVSGSTNEAADRAGRQIGPVHIADVQWEHPRTPDFPAGAGRKTLRDDPVSGRGFWMLAVLPHWSSPKTEWHTFTEENIVLEGDMQTASGVMRAGAYLSHPAGPDTAHGPMRSRSGALMITRAGGPLGTTYATTGQQMSGPWW